MGVFSDLDIEIKHAESKEDLENTLIRNYNFTPHDWVFRQCMLEYDIVNNDKYRLQTKLKELENAQWDY